MVRGERRNADARDRECAKREDRRELPIDIGHLGAGNAPKEGRVRQATEQHTRDDVEHVMLLREECRHGHERRTEDRHHSHTPVHAIADQCRDNRMRDVKRRKAVVGRIGGIQKLQAPRHKAAFVDFGWTRRRRRIQEKASVRGEPHCHVREEQSADVQILPHDEDR